MPEELKILVQKRLRNKIEEQIDNLLVYINKEDKINKLLLPFSSEYENLVNKPVNGVISATQIEKWKELLE